MVAFPTSLDSLTNPAPTDDVSIVSHSAQHINANDAIEALEAKVGIDGSAVTSSIDYKLTNASSSNPGHRHTTAHVTASTDKNYVTDAQLTVIGNTSGTNTGDQTSIVGITGTKAQFDTACSDGNFLYVGDIAALTDGDKGDITVSASGATWTIDNGVVTLAKQADMATASVVYRKTAGSGAPEVQTLATLKTDLGLTGTNSGDVTVSDSSEIDFTLTGQQISAALVAGSIDETKLDASVNASLDLADTAVQPAALASYVPYTGATANVDLGTFDLITDTITSDSSAGLILENASGGDVLHIGSGGGVNATAYGGWNFDGATADTIASFGASKTLTSLATATYPSLPELSYVKGATGAIQAQIDDKAPIASPTFTGTVSVPATNFTVGASLPFSDTAGTLTLQNVDALDATTEATIEAAIDTLANLTSIQGQTVTLAGALITSGANSLTLTTTGATNITLPTTGTVATLAGTESLTNKKLGSLTSNGFVKTSGGDGTLSVDTATYQASDATLTALAAYNTNGILTQTAADTFTGRTITGTTNQVTVTNGDGVSGNPTLSLPTVLCYGLTSTAITVGGVSNQALQITSATPRIVQGVYSNNGNGAHLFTTKSRSTSVGSFTAVQSGDIIAEHRAHADDGTGFIQAAGMKWEIDAAVSTNIVPCRYSISLQNSAGTFAERWRVDGTQILNSVPLTFSSAANAESSYNNIADMKVEPTTNQTANGPHTNDLNAGATIAFGELVYLDSSSTWQLTDADAASTAGGMIAIALAAGTAASPLNVGLPGCIVRNDSWTWTAGQTLYISTTAGAITATKPSGTDDVVRVVGFALTDDCIYFNPSPDYITAV